MFPLKDLTFHSDCCAVVSLVGAVRARGVALVLALVFSPQPLHHQSDLVPRVPLHSHLPVPDPALERGVRKAFVPGGHHSQLPPAGIVSVKEPLELLRARAFEPRHATRQREREASHAEQRSGGEGHVAAHGALEHCEKTHTDRKSVCVTR